MEFKPRVMICAPGWSISGGVRNLIEMGNGLQKKGYPVFGICPDKESPWYKIEFPYSAMYEAGEKFAPDIVFATFWATCNETKMMQDRCGARFRGYIVQHDESITYGPKVNETYNDYWDLCLTISPWLVDFLKKHGQENIGKFTPAYYPDQFKPWDNKEKKRVCFYSRPMERKRTEVGLEALRIIKREMPEVEIHTFDINPRPPVEYEVIHHFQPFGEELGKLYSSCTVAMQSTPIEGYGTMSLEPMACGTCVVTPDKEGTKEFPEGTVLYAEVDAKDIADKVMRLIKNPRERMIREQKGLEYAKTITFEKMVDEIEKYIQGLLI